MIDDCYSNYIRQKGYVGAAHLLADECRKKDAEIKTLKEQLRGYESYHADLNQAFNSGNGSYHP